MAKNCSITVKVEAWQKNSLTSYCIRHGHLGVTLPPDLELKGNTIGDLLRPIVDYLALYHAELHNITDADQAKEAAMHPYANSIHTEYEEEIGRLSKVLGNTTAKLNEERRSGKALRARLTALEAEVATLREELGVD